MKVVILTAIGVSSRTHNHNDNNNDNNDTGKSQKYQQFPTKNTFFVFVFYIFTANSFPLSGHLAYYSNKKQIKNKYFTLLHEKSLA